MRTRLSRAVMRTIADEIDGGNDQAEEPQEGTEGDTPTDDDDADDDQEEPTVDTAKLLAKVRKTNSENRALRERTKQAEAKAEGAGETAKRATELEAENLRLKLAIKHGIPEKLLSRLNGDTEDELLADAQELMELFEVKKPPTRKPTEKQATHSDRHDDEVKTLDDLAADMFRN